LKEKREIQGGDKVLIGLVGAPREGMALHTSYFYGVTKGWAGWLPARGRRGEVGKFGLFLLGERLF